ncbi:hypothetical protein ACB092_02G017300 [Castanea dentata]
MATLHFTPSPTLIPPRHNHSNNLSVTSFHLKFKPTWLSSPIVQSPLSTRTILTKALDSGLSIPHDCKLGVCMTCPARLLSGSVDQSDGMLSDDLYPCSDCHIRTIPEDELLSLQLATAND